MVMTLLQRRRAAPPVSRRWPAGAGCLLALWLALPCAAPAARVEDRIVAVVNSDLIMLSDVKRELEPERERIARQHRGDELAQRLKTAEYMALTKMIERRLQLQEAKARGVDVSDQEVKQAVAQLKQQGEKIDDADPLSLRNVRDQLILLKVVDREVRSGVMVGENEMKRYYQEHRDRFALPEEYQLSQILIQPRSPDDTADALAKARRVMEELKKGETFEDLALQYSDGPNASRGGRLGLVRQGELLPAIERAIAPLAPGGISDIIETPQGFHIIRVEEKKPKQFRPFEQVKLEIQGLVFQQKSEDVFQSWLVDLKNKAYIEIKF
ncbi:peptidylprolyl isomerase [Nitrospira moscoviensis]|uniref:Putative Peptidylprolyl isomerase n=1 Tax=Nitrospira moscoviensis TaxID=42253 RepID=A0A0K2GJ80_NITMO|nr:peptidyl-prolyl cis-trans isomerase [Nitrospira moscoviensis]ALA61000.1 putative Peptidylprolyl isomerase [Nitrospira moscoviensis]